MTLEDIVIFCLHSGLSNMLILQCTIGYRHYITFRACSVSACMPHTCIIMSVKLIWGICTGSMKNIHGEKCMISQIIWENLNKKVHLFDNQSLNFVTVWGTWGS